MKEIGECVSSSLVTRLYNGGRIIGLVYLMLPMQLQLVQWHFLFLLYRGIILFRPSRLNNKFEDGSVKCSEDKYTSNKIKKFIQDNMWVSKSTSVHRVGQQKRRCSQPGVLISRRNSVRTWLNRYLTIRFNFVCKPSHHSFTTQLWNLPPHDGRQQRPAEREGPACGILWCGLRQKSQGLKLLEEQVDVSEQAQTFFPGLAICLLFIRY